MNSPTIIATATGQVRSHVLAVEIEKQLSEHKQYLGFTKCKLRQRSVSALRDKDVIVFISRTLPDPDPTSVWVCSHSNQQTCRHQFFDMALGLLSTTIIYIQQTCWKFQFAMNRSMDYPHWVFNQLDKYYGMWLYKAWFVFTNIKAWETEARPVLTTSRKMKANCWQLRQTSQRRSQIQASSCQFFQQKEIKLSIQNAVVAVRTHVRMTLLKHKTMLANSMGINRIKFVVVNAPNLMCFI